MGIIEKKTVETIKATFVVTASHIVAGVSCDQYRCMHKLAGVEALKTLLGLDEDEIKKLHLRVRSDGIKFNYQGYRWHAPAPQKALNALILFDNPATRDQVKPHSYTVVAIKGEKVLPFTRERKDQINAARIARTQSGRPDKIYNEPTIHERIVGTVLDLRANNSGKKKKAA